QTEWIADPAGDCRDRQPCRCIGPGDAAAWLRYPSDSSADGTGGHRPPAHCADAQHRFRRGSADDFGAGRGAPEVGMTTVGWAEERGPTLARPAANCWDSRAAPDPTCGAS